MTKALKGQSARKLPAGWARTRSHSVDGDAGIKNGGIQGTMSFLHLDREDELTYETTGQNRESWARVGRGSPLVK